MKKVLLLILSFSTIAYAGESCRDFLGYVELELASDDERLFKDIAKNLFTGGALGPEELAFENATEPVGSAQGLSNYSNDPYFTHFAQNDETLEDNRIREVGSEEIGSVSDTPFGASQNTDNGVFPILQDANQEEEFQAGVNQDDRQLPKPSTDKQDNEKILECDACEKLFISNSALARHKRTHARKNPYECDVCKITFANKDLSNHRSHIKSVRRLKVEKCHKCDECGAVFAGNSDLTRHIAAIHLKVKSYQCDHCARAFADSSNLIKHIRFVHKLEYKKPQKCLSHEVFEQEEESEKEDSGRLEEEGSK